MEYLLHTQNKNLLAEDEVGRRRVRCQERTVRQHGEEPFPLSHQLLLHILRKQEMTRGVSVALKVRKIKKDIGDCVFLKLLELRVDSGPGWVAHSTQRTLKYSGLLSAAQAATSAATETL